MTHGRSISEIARRLIRLGLANLNADPLRKSRRKVVLERLRSIRQDIQEQTEIIVRDLIHEIREERSAYLHYRALEWSRTLGQLKTCDGQYLAAAEWAGAELWTADARLAEQARHFGATWVYSI